MSNTRNRTFKIAVGTIAITLTAAAVTAFVLFREAANPSAAGSARSALPDLARTRTQAETGDAAAQCLLGEILQEGKQTRPDFVEAAAWYRKSAVQGFARAQYCLGQLYDVGRGVAHDEAEAANWYLKAAESGHVDAQYIYASMCSLGRGITPNTKEALKWYHRAAEQGDGLSMYNLAERYERERGVPLDLPQACVWHALAASRGVEEAAASLKRLEVKITPEQKRDAQNRVDEFRKKFGARWKSK